VRSLADLDAGCYPRTRDPLLEEHVIRILLVVQMSLLRGALAAVLAAEDDIEVAAEIARLDEMIPTARAVRPDVVIIDIDLFGNGAFAAAYQLNDVVPGCATLVLADTDSPGAMRAALDTHVRGFVGKDCPPSRFVDYVRQVGRGERAIDPTLAVAALRAPRNPLTPRELEVLRVAASGVPSVEIADLLHLSVGTVRNYMSTIMRKTRARNRLEAVRIAEAAGWL
jgi:two-component system response regulator DesR